MGTRALHSDCNDTSKQGDMDSKTFCIAVFITKSTENAYPGLKFLALIVNLPQLCKVWLGLMLEEGVMQDLIVDVQFANFRLHAIPLLLLQFLVLLLFLQQTDNCLCASFLLTGYMQSLCFSLNLYDLDVPGNITIKNVVILNIKLMFNGT